MPASPLRDAFAHHVWATITLIDTCAALTPEQLATTVPGTYGSIIDTLRHTVGADTSYLALLSDGRVSPLANEETADPVSLRAAMERNGPVWQEVIAGDLDPDRVIVRFREDGSQSHAPLGTRIAQVLHHGSDHRSQVCTALTALGLEPPAIDAWDHADQAGRLLETPPAG